MRFVEGTGLEVLRGDARTLRLQTLRFSTFLIAHVKVDAFRVRWPRRRPSSQSRFLFLFISQGSVELRGDARRVASPEGGLCLVFPGTEPVEIETIASSELVAFSFDAKEIAPLTLRPEDIGVLTPRSTIIRACYAYLRSIVTADADPSAENTAVLRSLTRNVAGALGAEAIRYHPRGDHFAYAQQVIGEMSSDPRFAADALAAKCGISRRTLNRLYQRNGTQVAKEIRRARSQSAMELLVSYPDIDLCQIARLSGFGSEHTLTRSFQELFGVTPSAVRSGSRVPPERRVGRGSLGSMSASRGERS